MTIRVSSSWFQQLSIMKNKSNFRIWMEFRRFYEDTVVRNLFFERGSFDSSKKISWKEGRLTNFPAILYLSALFSVNSSRMGWGVKKD